MLKTIKNHKVKLLAILVIPFILTGCGLWGNFTTYFNLYYNASRLFNETEQEILLQRKVLFTVQDPRPGGNVSQNLTKVIEKLSKLLQFDAQSAYVDDALLMAGKCFYYQQDYQKALRKFTELISTFPNSDLTLEDQLWIGKTQLRLKNHTQANSVLDQVKAKAREENDKRILTQANIEQVSYLISVEKYEEAIATAQSLVNDSDDDQINAVAMYEIGKMYLKIDQPEKAAKAFAEVQNYSPTYETEYMAKVQYGKVQRKLGETGAALDIFTDIESEAKYNQFLDSTKLQIGLTYMELKRYDDAVKQFVFIDTTFRQSPNAGLSEFYLGDIMEHQFGNYDSAGYYYKKASSSTAPAEFVQKANRKVQMHTKYDNLHSAISQLSRQLVYLEKPEEYVKDSTEYAKESAIRDSLNKELEKQRMEEANNSSSDDYQNSRNSKTGRQDQNSLAGGIQKEQKNLVAPVKPVITADSLKIVLAKNEYELGSLFFTELNVLDSAYYYYSHILEAYPNTMYTPRALFALGTYYQTVKDTVKADSLFNVIYNKYPNESVVNAAADKLGKPLINLNFDAAEELFVEAEKKVKEKNFEEAVTGFQEV
ncbi:MAG: tetratricopeptide repeat protein, partial [Bacillota bacterium]